MLTPFFALAAKEIRTLLRGRRAFLFLMLTLGIIGGTFCLIWISEAGTIDIAGRARFSRTLFQMLGMTQLGVMGLVTPLLTATAFSGEREHKTLDLLYCTATPRLGLVLGKWLAAIVFQLAMVLCLLPVLSLSFQLGGVGLDEYLFTALIIAVAVAAYAMLGLAVSVRARRSSRAMMITLLIILVLNIGFLFVVAIIDNFLVRLPVEGPVGTLILTISPFYKLFFALIKDNGSPLLNSRLASMEFRRFLYHLAFQLALLIGSAWSAWRSLSRGETLKPLLAQKLIDDPALLARRRRRFPYYLVDPLRRAQEIRDDQDPVRVKEQRIGGAARLETTVRLGYAGLALSIMLIGHAIGAGYSSLTVISRIAQMGLGFTALFAPLLAATVISREREEGTLDLLLATPYPEKRIVRAKFRAVLRGLVILTLSATAIPVASMFIFTHESPVDLISALIKIFPMVIAFLAFYGALGVYCSSRSRRNMTAITASLLWLVLCFFAPAILIPINEVLDRNASLLMTAPLRLALAWVCPFISPLYSLEEAFGEKWKALSTNDVNWLVISIRVSVVAGLAWILLWRASRRLARRRDVNG